MNPNPKQHVHDPDPRRARQRNPAIDLLRGWVMILMVLDHTRGFYFGYSPKPTDLDATTPELFATRLITHLCAPVFVLLAGTAAYLYGTRHNVHERSRFLLSRGLWLMLLEVTVIRLGWVPDLFYRFTLLQVIWAIGCALVALAALSRLGPMATGAIGVVIIAAHNLLDPISPQHFGDLGWLWRLLHEPGAIVPSQGVRFQVAYPILPWIGVMAAGFGLGPLFSAEPEVRRRWLLGLGVALSVGFLLLRASNLYGDPSPWGVHPRGA
ncbi:MAG: heparan-alpha-glucosaminide N-acetyltransferase domain-containing protein, partial [Myxococcota bacterium]